MVRGLGLALLTTVTLAAAGVFGSVSDGAAQSTPDRSGAVMPYMPIILAQADQQRKGSPAQTAPRGPAVVTPRGPAQVVTPRGPAQVVTPRGPTNVVTPRDPARFQGPRNFDQGGAPKVFVPRTDGPKFVAPGSGGPRFVSPGSGGPRFVGPDGGRAGAVSIRGANRAMIAGRNYSVWRGSYRAHRGGYWRTFVGLGALGAIMYGSALYYPYAYIDAPAPYCEGLTYDGCQLQWQEVPTLEGPTEFHCVAYCPWQ